ncbi:E3 ubiquitin-protein ligase TRIM37-like [Onthophagus taurus]|uniref:E3 ubiquitin-protein ligase TRIM37-like n=1 Tax=Onthophagus taurus TaxID=166361 RepID=UPI000C207448|nr:E3 ubiquitin-protein ligase TRIM37-like [Onthophagus taurus]
MHSWSNVSDSSLTGVFKCFICASQVQDAHLCPHCSKLFCYDCISRWLTEQLSECPNCRVSLDVEELVACRWVAEVTQHLNMLQAHNSAYCDENPKDICTIHGEKLSVFCWTCHCCICHECALWGGTHTGHTFKPISEVYAQEVSRIRKEANNLRKRLTKLVTNAQQVEKAAVTIRRVKNQRLREMQDMIGKAVVALDRQLKPKMMTLKGQQQCITKESSNLEMLLSQIDHQLKTCSQSELLTKSAELAKMIYAVKQCQGYYSGLLAVER